MANELVARNGIIASSDSTINGKLTVTNGITGSITTASYALLAQTASYVVTAQTASFVNGTVATSSYALTAQTANTASYITLAQSASYVSNAVSASYATTSVTASYAVNLTVSGTLTAQTIVVSVVTSSVEFASGSNIIGNNVSNTQQITGSVTVTGSLALNGSPVIVTSQTSSLSVATASYVANAVTASYVLTAQTASYVVTAQTASFVTLAQSANSASYVTLAQTASYVTTAQTASYVASATSASYFNGNTFILSQSQFINQNGLFATATTITASSNATASYNSAFWNYSVSSGSNVRAGQLIAAWNGANIQYTDFSINDIGNTTGIVWTVGLIGPNVNLYTTTPSTNWVVRTVLTLL